MAGMPGQRAVVQDPLQQSPQQVLPDRSAPLSGVRAPQSPTMGGMGANAAGLDHAMGSLQDVIDTHIAEQTDEAITQGKTAYLTGVTEQKLMETGNRFSQMGYLQLKTRDDVNNWYLQNKAAIADSTQGQDPKAYQDQLTASRKAYLDGITDPYAKQVAVAAFEQFSPDLAASQFQANNSLNRANAITGFTDALVSGSQASPTRSIKMPDAPLDISPDAVEHVMDISANDRDIGIRTMIGEAGNEGTTGLAAVAHVLRNRATDGRWPKSIAGVALQEKQFSAWNEGAGGNNLVHQYAPGNPIYEKVGQIFDTVMSGRNVDMTGGATHYYSPAGMKALVAGGSQGNAVPSWAAGTGAESGGQVKIGGHLFSGKARGQAVARASVEPTTPSDQGDTSIEPGQYHDPIISAPNYGKDPANLQRDGANKTTPMLNAGVQAGDGVTGIKQVGAKNEVQDMILNYNGLNKQDRAVAVADAMRRQLDSGSDQLFKDAGGAAILYKLGAKPGDIDEVLRAQERFTNAQGKKYDSEQESWRSDTLAMAEDGKTPWADVQKRIDDRYAQGKLDDTGAQSLARQASDKIRATAQQAKDKAQNKADAEAERNKPTMLSNTDFLTEVGGLYQQITAGGLPFEQASAQAKTIASKYGIENRQTEQVLGHMFELDQGRQNTVRTQAEELHKQQMVNASKKSDVDAMVARGYGLANASGTVKAPNPFTGKLEDQSAQEYGVNSIKDQKAAQYKALVDSGKMVPSVAVGSLTRDIAETLQAHDVIDKDGQAQMIAAVKGNILGQDKKITPEALQAYDTYQMMRNDATIKPGYLAKQVGDDYTRNLMELTYTLDQGNLNSEDALLKAKEQLDNPLRDPQEKMDKGNTYQTVKSKVLGETMKAMTDVNWWTWIKGNFDPQEQVRAMAGTTQASNYIERRADSYHAQYPQQTPEVTLKLATDDLKSNSTVIAGNLLISPDGGNFGKRMGVDGYGETAAQDATKAYLAKFAPIMFADSWQAVHDAKAHRTAIGVTPEVPYNITFNADVGPQGSFMVSVIKDPKTGETFPGTKAVRIDEIGKWYQKQQEEVTTWDTMWNKGFGAVGDAAATTRKLSTEHAVATEKVVEQGAQSAGQVGASMGALFKPHKK